MASLTDSASIGTLSPKKPPAIQRVKDLAPDIQRPKNPPPPEDHESTADTAKIDDEKSKNPPTNPLLPDQTACPPKNSPVARVVDPVFAHKVYEYFHPNESHGYMYTVGLHALGFPELVALNLPRHRTWIVKKNMDFLALKMIQGVPVLHGHRSTDYNYRVNIIEITQEHERLRLVSARLLHVHPKARILNLVPFYQDAEEWGSFPPTPDGQRWQRDRILSFLLFPQNSGANGLILFPNDIKYFLDHKTHFQRILMCADLQTLLTRLHAHCHWNAMPGPSIPSSYVSPRSAFSTPQTPQLPFFHYQGTPVITNTTSSKKTTKADTKKETPKATINRKAKRKTPPRSSHKKKKKKPPSTPRIATRAFSPNSDKENHQNRGQMVVKAIGHRGKELRLTTEVNIRKTD